MWTIWTKTCERLWLAAPGGIRGSLCVHPHAKHGTAAGSLVLPLWLSRWPEPPPPPSLPGGLSSFRTICDLFNVLSGQISSIFESVRGGIGHIFGKSLPRIHLCLKQKIIIAPPCSLCTIMHMQTTLDLPCHTHIKKAAWACFTFSVVLPTFQNQKGTQGPSENDTKGGCFQSLKKPSKNVLENLNWKKTSR